MSAGITTAAPPTTAEVAADLAAWIGGQSGVLTDFNPGSQVRTDAEALGSVIEMQGVINQAEVFQAMVYSAWAAFNIIPQLAISSAGPVLFITGGASSPPQAPFDILIPAGTIVQTVGGTQFVTASDVVLPTGSTSVAAVVTAVVPGAGGNVPIGAISQIATALPFPLQVRNTAPTVGGDDAETAPQTMARFTATIAALGKCTPVAVANACIGVTFGNETVAFATVDEPWIAQAQANVSPLTPGFNVYIDNGSGAASFGLRGAVTTKLNGDAATGDDGDRPAGVPFTVNGVTAVPCSVTVTGKALTSGLDAGLTAATISAINSYFAALAFGEPAQISTLLPVIANQVAGNVTSLTVVLLNSVNVAVTVIQPPGIGRVILTSSTVTFT